jgi:hypothetical protein
VLPRSSLPENNWSKPTGVLEHCRDGETNCLLSIFSGGFFLTASLRRRRVLK